MNTVQVAVGRNDAAGAGSGHLHSRGPAALGSACTGALEGAAAALA